MRDFQMLNGRLKEIEAKAIAEMAKEHQITVSEAVRNLLHSAIDSKRRDWPSRRAGCRSHAP